MQRDNDYIRSLLFEIENRDESIFLFVRHMGQSYDEEKMWYHLQLLCDSGFLFQENESAYRLTAEGHDFIESIRDEGIWNQTQSAVAETGGTATLELIKAIGLGYVKKKLSEHTGIEL